jgi:hypothetical protein
MVSLSEKGHYIFSGNQDGRLDLVAQKRNSDGTLDRTPAGYLNASVFGENGFGPQFVQQIM